MVDAVVLVGGATKTPLIAGLVSAVAGVAPTYVSGAPPDHAGALGAAVQVGVIVVAFEDVDPEGGLGVMNPLQAALLRALAKREGLI
jgi:molecular chaperone DnaK (HSP70)